MKILVTGGSGFLGSHLCDALSKCGQKLVLFDKNVSAFRTVNQKMLVGDVMDRKAVFQAVKEADIVFHLAAKADLDTMWASPYSTMAVNVLGTTNLLEASRLCGVKKFIFASTLYADSNKGGLYGVSKHAGEELVKEYNKYCGLPYTILRFGTLYGTRAKDNNSIRGLLKQALKGKIDYYGTGKEVREYIHVRDAAKICTTLLDKHTNETLILTGYQRFKLTEILDMIDEIVGGIEIQYHPSKAHYQQTPNSYVPSHPKKIIPETSCDMGGSLVEIMKEINETR